MQYYLFFNLFFKGNLIDAGRKYSRVVDGSDDGDRWGWMQCGWMGGIGSWGVGKGRSERGSSAARLLEGVGLNWTTGGKLTAKQDLEGVFI